MAHVTFVHGISNMRSSDLVLEAWKRALARNDGIDLGAEGVTSSLIYWADVMYPEPRADDDINESADDGVAEADLDEIDLSFVDEADGDERAWLQAVSDKYQLDAAEDEAPPPAEPDSPLLERIPLPWFLKKRIMGIFLRDVHHYLFDVDHEPRPGTHYKVQTEIRRRFQEALATAADSGPPHVVIAHSMGTVISYDNLKRVTGCPPIDGLITLGSPLGLDEIQDKLRPEWARDTGFPDTVTRWVNVYDRFDPVVGLDARFANDYRKQGADAVVDINEQNWGKFRHPVTKYLAGPRMREELGSMLEL
jgi:hypothetical protein